MIALLLLPVAEAGEFMDVWVTSAFEDTNVFAGPEAYSPSPNFVERGNSTFFENYESRFTDDISQSYLVLYRKDDGFQKGWFTEAALVLRFQPYLEPDRTEPGVNIADDGSYVRVGRKIGDRDDHTISLTGYAVDSNRFRLGYSYDLTWGGKNIYVFDPIAAPGARLQYQNGSAYVFVGAKTAVGDYIDPVTGITRNQAYYGTLGGLGGELGKHLRVEGGVGSFQQGQLTNVEDATSDLYNAPIYAVGGCAQVAVRTNPDLDYIVSNELKLYRNNPDFVKDSYITHAKLEGTGLLVQSEGNLLAHNLLDPQNVDSTTIEKAFAGDVQAMLVSGSTVVQLDGVYKDLPYILFNVPGFTSNYAISSTLTTTPQLYVRGKVSHYFEGARVTPSLGVGWMQPATYTTSDGAAYVQYTERDKRAVPAGQAPTAILSSVLGVQWDISKSVVAVGEVLYTLDNNLSDYVQVDDLQGEYVPAAGNERNDVGFNLMMRARF
jgi:hypothetical protein